MTRRRGGGGDILGRSARGRVGMESRNGRGHDDSLVIRDGPGGRWLIGETPIPRCGTRGAWTGMEFFVASIPRSQLDPTSLDAAIQSLQGRIDQLQMALTEQQKLATLGMVTAVIAHEFNNILTPMISYTKYALGDKSDAALQEKALQRRWPAPSGRPTSPRACWVLPAGMRAGSRM